MTELVGADSLDHHVDLGGYMLGTLTAAETVAFEAHLAQCETCQQDLGDLGDLGELLDLAAFAGVDIRLEEPGHDAVPAIGADVVPLATRRSRSTGPRKLWLAGAAAAAVAGLVVVGGLMSRPDSPTGNPKQVALVAAPGQTASGTATVRTGENGTLVDLDLTGLAPTSAGERFECWWVSNGVRVSAGSFEVGEGGTANVKLLVAASRQPPWKLNVNRVGPDERSITVLSAETKAT